MIDYQNLLQIGGLNAQEDERQRNENVLKRFAHEDVGGPNSFHEGPARKLSEEKLENLQRRIGR